MHHRDRTVHADAMGTVDRLILDRRIPTPRPQHRRD
jgi:hypothetical protein